MRRFKKALAVLGMGLVATAASANSYQCKVYCKGPDGSTSVRVNASSSEVARIVDRQSDQICRSAGHSRSTSSTMSASQCN